MQGLRCDDRIALVSSALRGTSCANHQHRDQRQGCGVLAVLPSMCLVLVPHQGGEPKGSHRLRIALDYTPREVLIFLCRSSILQHHTSNLKRTEKHFFFFKIIGKGYLKDLEIQAFD